MQQVVFQHKGNLHGIVGDIEMTSISDIDLIFVVDIHMMLKGDVDMISVFDGQPMSFRHLGKTSFQHLMTWISDIDLIFVLGIHMMLKCNVDTIFIFDDQPMSFGHLGNCHQATFFISYLGMVNHTYPFKESYLGHM